MDTGQILFVCLGGCLFLMVLVCLLGCCVGNNGEGSRCSRIVRRVSGRRSAPAEQAALLREEEDPNPAPSCDYGTRRGSSRVRCADDSSPTTFTIEIDDDDDVAAAEETSITSSSSSSTERTSLPPRKPFLSGPSACPTPGRRGTKAETGDGGTVRHRNPTPELVAGTVGEDDSPATTRESRGGATRAGYPHHAPFRPVASSSLSQPRAVVLFGPGDRERTSPAVSSSASTSTGGSSASPPGVEGGAGSPGRNVPRDPVRRGRRVQHCQQQQSQSVDGGAAGGGGRSGAGVFRSSSLENAGQGGSGRSDQNGTGEVTAVVSHVCEVDVSGSGGKKRRTSSVTSTTPPLRPPSPIPSLPPLGPVPSPPSSYRSFLAARRSFYSPPQGGRGDFV